MSRADQYFDKKNYKKEKVVLFADNQEHDTLLSYTHCINNESINFYLESKKISLQPALDGSNSFDLDADKLKAIYKKAQEMEWF